MAKVWEREDEYNEKYKKEKDKSTASKADEKILEERNDLPAVLLVALIGIRVLKPEWLGRGYIEFQSDEIDASKPDIDVELLTVNPYSGRGQRQIGLQEL